MKKLILLGLILLSPAFAHADFNTNLKYGAKGESVREMQEFLADQGVYTGPITGNFYALTLKAVKTFQSNNDISPASGFWGPLTRTKANSLLDLTASDTAEQAETGTLATPTFDNDKLLEELKKQTEAQNRIAFQIPPTTPPQTVPEKPEIGIYDVVTESFPPDAMNQSPYTPVETITWRTSIPTNSNILVKGNFTSFGTGKDIPPTEVRMESKNKLSTFHTITLRNSVLFGQNYTFTIEAVGGDNVSYKTYQGTFLSHSSF